MEWVQAHWLDVYLIVTTTVTLASLITKLTPNTWDDSLVSKIMKFLALIPSPKK